MDCFNVLRYFSNNFYANVSEGLKVRSGNLYLLKDRNRFQSVCKASRKIVKDISSSTRICTSSKADYKGICYVALDVCKGFVFDTF